MADIQSNININVDTTNATAAIRNLQAQISTFHQQMQKSGSAANAATSANMQRNLINNINATNKFSASLTNISTETESFTNALEKNKLSMGQYFRYAGASSKTFGRSFRNEFNTISKVAESRVRTLQTQYVKMGRDASGAMKAIKIRPLSLDMQNLSTQTMLASQKQQIFNQLLRQGSTNLLNFGKNTQWAGRQLMVGFTVPLSIMGATAIKEFQKIEEQVIRLKRVYGDLFTTNAETEKAVEQVRELAEEFTKYGIAVESTIGLAATVAQMGNVGADMINQVTEATNLAILGGMEQEKALDTTISLTNAFGIATEDLTEKINFLNAAENQTILAIDDFTEAVPKAGSVVAQLGGSVEDLAFFLTAMREGGVNASQAANALKSSLARLVNPTKQARDDLSKLGIDVIGIVESNVGDLRGTIMDLGVALDELEPLQRSRALEELFGKFQFARMSTLFQNISKEGSQAQEILKLTRNSAEELQVLADRELSRVEESPATKLQKSIEKLQASLAPIGAEFVKLITPLVEFITDVLKRFNEMGDGAKSFVTGLVTILGLIAPAAIMAFGLIANGIANLMKAFNAYRSFLQILSGSNRDITTTTQYMTQEQLEAASVATNLGQAHQYLAQQFTVEASALAQLTEVYRAATVEQLKYSAATTGTPARPVGPMRVAPPITRATAGRRAVSPGGPVGYNKGTLSVPGPRGAGDIVPAVLSPGEAVIPARQSQKYSGFLEAIMNDQVPGMFFGGIAGMLGRSRVATRMSGQTFSSSLRSGDLSYKSGFATGTGADFTDRLGRPMKQHQLMRRQAENKLYGTPVGSNDPSMRPTYGSVAMSPLQRILATIFGGRKGRQFASVTNPMASSLDQYGDISLIGKRSMNQRASTFAGDTLLKYSKNPAWVRGTAPMRGATQSQMQTAGFDAFNTPFGQNKLPGGGTSVNPQLPYIEAQTMGGFNYNEIDKIVTRNPAMRRQLKQDLKTAGLGGIKVGGPGFISSLFTKLGVPGFKDGIFSVPGPKGAGDIIPSMLAPGEAVVPAKQTQKYAGLIKGIISDSIPGFVEGKPYVTGGQSLLYSGLGMRAPGNQTSFGMDRDFFTTGDEFGTSMLGATVGGAATIDDPNRDMSKKLFAEYANEVGEFVPQIVNELRDTYHSMVAAGESVDNIEQVVERAEGKLQKIFQQMEQKGGKSASAAKALREDMFYPTEESMRQRGEVRAPAARVNSKGKLASTIFRNKSPKQKPKVTTATKYAYEAAGIQEQKGRSYQYAHMQEKRLQGDILPMFGNTKDLSASEQKEYEGIVNKKSAIIRRQFPEGQIVSAKRVPTSQSVSKELDSENLGTSSGRRSRRAYKAQTTVAAQEAKKEAQAYVNEFTNTVEQAPSPYETISDPEDKQKAAAEGSKTGREYGRKFDIGASTTSSSAQSGAPIPPRQRRRSGAPAGAPPSLPTSPGGVPQPGGYTSPIVDPLNTSEGKRESGKSAKGFVQRFSKGVKNAGTSVGKKAMNAFEKSNIGQSFVSRLGAAAGNTVVGSDGNVIYDADKDVRYDSAGNVVASGMAAGQAGQISEDIVVGPDGNPIVDKKGNPVSQKQADRQARKMASRQKRGMVAGRLAGAMGSASMMLGMSSMMPGVGDNPIMQQIQGFMPALFALSAVLPMLAALPGPLGLLVGVVGAVAAGLVMWNMELKKTREEYRELGESLSAGTDSMQAFANAAGKATPSETMDLRRQGIGEQVQYAVGKSPFATQFFDSEDGQSLVSNFEDSSSKVGRNVAISSVTNQLATAIASGILSREQAGQIALELGNQIDDFGVSIAIAGELNELFGPNGEKLLDGEPLEIFINTSERSLNALKGNVEQAIEAITNESSFISEVFQMDDAAIAGFAAGALTGFVQEQEMALDAFEVQSEKRITSLEEEADKLEQNGQDASAIYKKIADERESQEQARLKALDIYQNNISGVASAISDDAVLSDDKIQQLMQRAENTIDTAISAEAASAAGSGSTLSRDERVEQEFSRLANEAETVALRPILNAFGDGLKAEIDENMPEAMQKVTKGVIDKFMSQDDLSVEAKILMSASIAGGDLDATSIVKLIDEDGEGYFEIIGEIMLKGGPQATAQIDTILQTIANFTGEDYEETMFRLFAELKGLEGLDLSNTLDQLTMFSTFSSILGEQSMLEFLSLSPSKKKEIQNSIDLMDELVDSTPDEPLTVEQVIEQKVLTDQSMIAAFKADAEFFEDLDPIQQFLYIQRFVAIQSTVTEEQAVANLINRGVRAASQGSGADRFAFSKQQIQDEISRIALEDLTKLTFDIDKLLGNTPGTPGGEDNGGGPVTSSLDEILNKLRNVRDETVQLKETWVDSFAEINRVVGEGIEKFEGLSQQLRKLGANQPLIQYILGMSPEEYEERKDELLDFSGNKVVGLKEGAENLQVALNAIKLGEFQDAQQSSIQAIGAQTTAVTKLVAAGYKLEDAYEIISDEALAYAIAAEENVDVMNELVKVTKEAAAANESFAFSQKLVTDASATATKDSVADWISENIPDINKAMFDAVLSDEYISGLLDTLQGGGLITQEQFDQIEDFFDNLVASGEVDLKVGDIEFSRAPIDEFNEGMSNVQNKFKIMETTIELKYEGINRADEGIIRTAENDIALLNYELDDLNAEIEDISDKEREVNEKYDKRFEALDKIKQVNSDISAQQKEQLSVADALSRGDIAAAAKAVQESRAKEQERRTNAVQAALEKRKESELASIRSASGQTREELETKIRDLQIEIRNIEEKRLEPAQERIRLQNILMEDEIEGLTVLEKTQTEWNNIQNAVDLATTSTDAFTASLKAARDVAAEIADGTLTPEDLNVAPTPDISAEDIIGDDQIQAEPEEDTKPEDKDPEPEKQKDKTYTVKRGDSLSAIASRLYGDSSKWRKIYNANRGIIGSNPSLIYPGQTFTIPTLASGGMATGYGMGGQVNYFPMGGMIPYKSMGGMFKSLGSDTIPAMLTPGEFVIKRSAVNEFGVDNLEKINSTGQLSDGSVYNYSVNVNVRSDANPDEIAQSVISQIKRVDGQRIRGNKF